MEEEERGATIQKPHQEKDLLFFVLFIYTVLFVFLCSDTNWVRYLKVLKCSRNLKDQVVWCTKNQKQNIQKIEKSEK